MRNENSKSALSEYFNEVFTDEHPSMELGDGPAHRLTLTVRDGTSYSLAYLSLNQIRFEPGTSLKLEFSGSDTFEIQGVNLDRLFDALCRHEVRAIRQIPSVPPEAATRAVAVLEIQKS